MRIFWDPENPKSSSQLGTEEKEVETRMRKLNGVSGLQRILGNVDFIFLKRLYGKENEFIEWMMEILTYPYIYKLSNVIIVQNMFFELTQQV